MVTPLIVILNLSALAFVLSTLLVFHENPAIIVYTFVFSALARLMTLWFLLEKQRQDTPSETKSFLSRFYSLPAPGQVSQPYTREETGQPVGPLGYFLVLFFVAVLSFILMNVGEDKQLHLAPSIFGEIGWSCLFAGIYWAKDLFGRAIVLDPGQSEEINFGYNSSGLTILVVAVLIGGFAVVLVRAFSPDPTPWVVCGPLLGLKHLVDLYQDLKRDRD